MDFYQRYRLLILSILQPAKSNAEDLCHDTFLSFIENYPDVKDDIEIKRILCTIARNKLKDYYKEANNVRTYLAQQHD